ncbi:pentapeptide repeat-containing protein [Herbidospora galbida]|uniref:pentapeptide repeat-containing protein n=1 Tax=Herbidospora galbida TaxID=2575442 RepID=UPI001484F47C|nr:pentapeptide repeat-containing protein [Herbidospora galbida]
MRRILVILAVPPTAILLWFWVFFASGYGGWFTVFVVSVCMIYVYLSRNAQPRVRNAIRVAVFILVALDVLASREGYQIGTLIGLNGHGPKSAVVAGVAVFALAIAVGRGIYIRWQRSAMIPITAPTPRELEVTLTPKERVELLTSQRQTALGAITSLGVALSVLFTAGGLIYSGLTWETSKETQITDRYTKAVEQLSSEIVEVRLGGLYALNRIAIDSEKDTSTIQNVMAAFVRNRDFCKQKIGDDPCAPLNLKGRLAAGIERISVPADVRAALELACSLQPPALEDNVYYVPINLAGVRFREADLLDASLRGADFTRADLASADLGNADLTSADMSEANLTNTNLNNAFLTNAILFEADLASADLTNAHLTDAILTDADLADAVLMGADLAGAYLAGADLKGANLKDADLKGVNLEGADLRNLKGLTVDQIKKVAVTDADTIF